MEFSRSGKRKIQQIIGMIALFLFVSSTGCGLIKTATTATTCEAGTAQIGVMDGALKRMCGCTEQSGAVFNGTSFTCTITAGTRLYFYFLNIQSQHRIQIQGTAQTTQQMNPGSSTQVDANIYMGATGTFTFIDANDATLGGTLTVN